MTYEADTFDEYVALIPDERRPYFTRLRKTIRENIPEGFEEGLSYGMPGFVVPHRLYPDGYHCRPEEPLPFISLASQKNFIGFYHMALYAMPDLLEWFSREWNPEKYGKLDMGKSCIRLKKMEQIPYALLGELSSKITVSEWIETYATSIRR